MAIAGPVYRAEDPEKLELNAQAFARVPLVGAREPLEPSCRLVGGEGMLLALGVRDYLEIGDVALEGPQAGVGVGSTSMRSSAAPSGSARSHTLPPSGVNLMALER